MSCAHGNERAGYNTQLGAQPTDSAPLCSYTDGADPGRHDATIRQE